MKFGKKAIDTIESVIASGVLIPELTSIPSCGATDDEIRLVQLILGRPLCSDHAQILRKWNGMNLDVVGLLGCGNPPGNIGKLADSQDLAMGISDGAIEVGSDPAGFAYIQTKDGKILSLDTDGGELEQVATSLDDFFERLVFGVDAASFGGEEWLAELRAAGVVAGQ